MIQDLQKVRKEHLIHLLHGVRLESRSSLPDGVMCQLKTEALLPGLRSSNPGSTTYLLYDFGQIKDSVSPLAQIELIIQLTS